MKNKAKNIILGFMTPILLGVVITPILSSCSNPFGSNHKKTAKTNIVVKEVTLKDLGITGISGDAILTTPPQSTSRVDVQISRWQKISNGDIILVTYRSKVENETVNGEITKTFSIKVLGLQENPGIKTIAKPSKPDIVITGTNGKGTFRLPISQHAIVTATQNTNLKNGDLFTITIRAEKGYRFGANTPEVSFDYQVHSLKVPTKNLSITKPTLIFRGEEGKGRFDYPSIDHVGIVADHHYNLSNKDQVILTIKAYRGYTINGAQQISFTYKVSGLVRKTNASIIVKKQDIDLNDIHVQEMPSDASGSQKMVMGYFGNDYKKSPIIFTSNYVQQNKINVDNAPAGKAPFIKKNEMAKFMKLYFKYIVHGPEFATMGVVSIDNHSLISQKSNLGWMDETRLSSFGTKPGISKPKYAPENKAKSLVAVNSLAVTSWYKTKNRVTINYNDLDSKFGVLYSTLQHEYGHNASHYETMQTPSFIGAFTKKYPDDIYKVGLNNGYGGDSEDQYLSSVYIKQLAEAIGVGSADANQNTVLSDLLAEKQVLRINNASTKDIDEKLSLWILRVMIGKRNGPSNSLLDKNKAFLYPGHQVDDNFKIKHQRYYQDSKTSYQDPSYKIFGDYESGTQEIMTRMFTFLTNRTQYFTDTFTYMSLITGMNPYYNYSKNSLNFSKKAVGVSRYGVTNEIKTNGDDMTITGNLAGSWDEASVYSREIRVPELNQGKLDRLVNFYTNAFLGYGKNLSLFVKGQTVNHKNNWSLNLLGGWTKKKHQYLIANPSYEPTKIINTKSIAYEISNNDTGIVSFRGKGPETWKNRSINRTDYKSWFVDLSSNLTNTTKTYSDLATKNHFSFWDDLNKDGVIEVNEITPILWNSTKNFFPNQKKMFRTGQTTEFFHSNTKSAGEIITSGTYDANNPFVLIEDNGYIKIKRDKWDEQ